MSSSTPNIGLTLPTGGERVSRQIINENNTKIDTYAGELSEQIGNLTAVDKLVNDAMLSAGQIVVTDCNWNKYKLLIFHYRLYSNILETNIVANDWFRNTSSGIRIIMDDSHLQIYKKTDTSINIIHDAKSSPYNVMVYGVCKIG